MECVASRHEVAPLRQPVTYHSLTVPTRLLTDVTGPFYTVVLELTVSSLGAFEEGAPRLLGDKDWQANYQKIGSLVESGYREIFTLVE